MTVKPYPYNPLTFAIPYIGEPVVGVVGEFGDVLVPGEFGISDCGLGYVSVPGAVVGLFGFDGDVPFPDPGVISLPLPLSLPIPFPSVPFGIFLSDGSVTPLFLFVVSLVVGLFGAGVTVLTESRLLLSVGHVCCCSLLPLFCLSIVSRTWAFALLAAKQSISDVAKPKNNFFIMLIFN